MLQSVGLQRVRHDSATKHQPRLWADPGAFAFFFFLVHVACRDLSTLTKDQTCAPCSGNSEVLNPGQPEKSAFVSLNPSFGNSLAVQCLGLHDSTAGGTQSIPSWGTKVPHAMQHGQKLKIKQNVNHSSSSLLSVS